MRNALSFILTAFSFLAPALEARADDEAIRFYIGTATNANKGGGVFLSSLSLKSGEISEPMLAAATDRSTFIWLHPKLPVLYSVAELSASDGGAAIVAWEIEPASGKLTQISHQPAGGQGACFVTARPDGRYTAIANYGSGSISLYPLESDGSVNAASANIQHIGTGPVSNRQAGPHAHSVRFDPSGERLLAADLGTDDIFVYDIAVDGSLRPSSPPSLEMPAGSGPRHFVFSPDNRYLLGLGEISGTISTFALDPINANPLSTVSTMAADVPNDAPRSSAEILFHPSLPVVYCSNRGPHEIAAFDFDTATGVVKRRSAIQCGGQVPRNFRLSPDGRFLLVANQGSNNIAVFTVDSKTGDLSPTKHKIDVPSPMCIKFVGDHAP